MRKQIIGVDSPGTLDDGGPWLDLEPIARVEISSEAPDYPIEAALSGGPGGWRAGGPGPQTIRLCFDMPRPIRRIKLVFVEQAHPRTQEFALRWWAAGGESYQEILRQQFTFSPPGTSEEREEYRVDLAGVAAIELRIIPDVSGGQAPATLSMLRLA